ncbi:MAG: hypothetical protein U0794_05195 [Isosphaeraceae bacterium]
MIKSTPRLATGDTATLPALAQRTSSLFRTVLLADVRSLRDSNGDRRYRLARIGRGLCVPSDGVDLVVTGGRASEMRERLGFLETQVLEAAEKELERGEVVGHSDRVTLYRTPGRLKLDQEQTEIGFVYAFRLEPTSGALSVLVWAIPPVGTHPEAPSTLTLLEPGLSYRCDLDVKAERLFGTVPIRWNFAMTEMPPGRRFVIPDRLRAGFRDPALAVDLVEKLFEGTDRTGASEASFSSRPAGTPSTRPK